MLETALNAALEVGYRHIDTTYVFENEKIIGRWISTGKIKRDNFYITTKLALCGVHPDRVEMMLKESLEELRLNYVDLYLLHFPVGTNYVERCLVTPPTMLKLENSDHVELCKKMEEQVDAGRTKAIRLSNFNRKQIVTILKSCRIKPAYLQIEIHVAIQQRELDGRKQTRKNSERQITKRPKEYREAKKKIEFQPRYEEASEDKIEATLLKKKEEVGESNRLPAVY
ncbi:unnamed protein product [Acanthoscelides obtectus]|uniref:NADP-dependent oxidoreductase domain-containing protein n=1 Tax=Acanthoscelides obtectus TaxID=200917 RepID=A0A9P0LIZ6_ACAOB|nr:unnamed protein product [Acanthoscelides obtectus]CAK1626986.1 Aldose reductase [Acanthoscelides obtectus]